MPVPTKSGALSSCCCCSRRPALRPRSPHIPVERSVSFEFRRNFPPCTAFSAVRKVTAALVKNLEQDRVDGLHYRGFGGGGPAILQIVKQLRGGVFEEIVHQPVESEVEGVIARKDG